LSHCSGVRTRSDESPCRAAAANVAATPTAAPFRPLRVMKFGGTSVGDAPCIARVVEIIRTASLESDVVVVVSAMRGVTDEFIRAAHYSAAREQRTVGNILDRLRKRHDAVLHVLMHSTGERERVRMRIEEILELGEVWCHATSRSGTLTPAALDEISGLGERLSAPLVACALSEAGVASEAVDATELIVTDGSHGAAEPQMALTSAKCQARLRALLCQGITPVITGFIGAAEDGTVTTLGRGGSDYSATIFGAALDADEVIVWTDVDGVMTADPRLDSGARTIPELSYCDAAQIAQSGAKVLHPKTLAPVMQLGIPVWVRNTFAPDGLGTKITATGLQGAD